MDSTQDGVEAYRRTKEMFNELQMNMRDFISNNSEVVEGIRGAGRSNKGDPKVLCIN